MSKITFKTHSAPPFAFAIVDSLLTVAAMTEYGVIQLPLWIAIIEL